VTSIVKRNYSSKLASIMKQREYKFRKSKSNS